MAALTCVSRSPPLLLPNWTALSMSRWYAGLFAAWRISEGFVVASWGL